MTVVYCSTRILKVWGTWGHAGFSLSPVVIVALGQVKAVVVATIRKERLMSSGLNYSSVTVFELYFPGGFIGD